MKGALVLSMVAIATASALAMPLDTKRLPKNSEGREFWICFMKNFREDGKGQQRGQGGETRRLQLFITSSSDARVRIEVEGIRMDTSLVVRANSVVSVLMPTSVMLSAVGVPERRAIHITADSNISVYGLNTRYQTTDTYMALPIQALGTEYRVMGYTKLAPDLLSGFSIIATEDGTEVTITPTALIKGGRLPNKPYTVRLRRGDVYTAEAEWESVGASDVTGSLVSSNKPISVFSGHTCAYVPVRIEACNHLVEQVPPLTSWGKHFYLGMLKERTKYNYRVLASSVDTKVFEDSRLVAMLRPGEFYEGSNISRHIQLTADKPVLVAQFAQGFKNGDSVGDPMMILVSPTQQFLKEYRFATPIDGDWHHYINVVTPTSSIKDIRLNGRRLDSTLFMRLGESRYSLAQVSVPFGTHTIKGSDPFGLYNYGFGFGKDAYDAYGNMSGQSFEEIRQGKDSLPPLVEGGTRRDEYIVMFRDDRSTDRGMSTVRVAYAYALEAVIPKIEPGVPQTSVRVRPNLPGVSGRIVLEAVDLAGNSSFITICHAFDAQSDRYAYFTHEGRDGICVEDQAWFAGVYAVVNHSFHSPNFMGTADVQSAGGPFTSGQGTSGWLGGVVGKRLSSWLSIGARMTVQTLGGTLTAPDSTVTPIFDAGSGSFVDYQEGTDVSIGAPLVTLGATAELYASRSVYGIVGAQLSTSLGSAVSVERRILQPSNVTFDAGSRVRRVDPRSLSSLNTFNVGVMAGLGFTYPISFRTNAVVEAVYTRWLGSVVSDADWGLEQLGVHLGVRWRW